MSLSEDGKRVAFLVAEESKNFIVRDGEVVAESNVAEFDVNWPLAMSADGSVLAWSGNSKRHGEVAVNGVVRRNFREVRHVQVSRNGKTVAFAARRKDDAWFIVINGKEGPECDEIGMPIAISADGTTIGYYGADDRGGFLQIGDKPLPIPPGYLRLHLSPEGSPIFEKRDAPGSGRRFFEWKGMRGPSFSEIEPPSFAPDGKSITYGATNGETGFVVVGGRTVETPGRIGSPVFSPDGSAVGYGALVGREIWWKVIAVR